VPDFTFEKLSFAYDYYIFIDGSRIKARNGKTGLIQFTDISNTGHADVVLQACCNALTSGGTICIGPGTFDIYANVTSSYSINIRGSGIGVTTLRRQIATTQHTILNDGSNVKISDLTIDGNYPTNTSAVGTAMTELRNTGNNVLIDNIEIKNFAGQAAIVQYGQHVTINKCKIFGVSLINKSGWGVLPYIITNRPITYIKDCWIEGCWINAIFGMGITIMEGCYFANNCLVNGGQIGSNSGGDTLLTKVINCTFEPGLGNDSGIECEFGQWIVTGNRVRGNVYGILVHNTTPATPTTSTIISDNIVYNNNFEGIVIKEPLTHFVIRGNISYDDRGSPQQGAGIKVYAGASDHYIITNNICYGNTVAQIQDLGTGTDKIVANNISA
jgi:hypothetical protein